MHKIMYLNKCINCTKFHSNQTESKGLVAFLLNLLRGILKEFAVMFYFSNCGHIVHQNTNQKYKFYNELSYSTYVQSLKKIKRKL